VGVEGGGRAIGKELALNTTLTQLDLEDNDLGDGGGYCAANSVNIEEVPAYTHAFNARAEGAIRICKEKV
jgi:hypothetical protein